MVIRTFCNTLGCLLAVVLAGPCMNLAAEPNLDGKVRAGELSAERRCGADRLLAEARGIYACAPTI